MSFHGGLLGVGVALYFYSKSLRKGFWETIDFIVPFVPFGLGAGRIGNFIGGELWGRPTDVPWGMVFPHVDQLPRHPSQLYEVALEGVALLSCYGGFHRILGQGWQCRAYLHWGTVAFVFSLNFSENQTSKLGLLPLNG